MKIEVAGRLDYFTGRQAELAAYDALWDSGNEGRVLCLGGLSGIGKSTLLEYLKDRHQPRRSAVLIDLADSRLRVGYLFVTALAHQLRQAFPALGWRRYNAAEAAADEQGARLRAMQPQVSVQQEQSARGRGSTISQSPQIVAIDTSSLAAEIGRRVTEHEDFSRMRLLDTLCFVLARAQPFAILVDTYEVAAHAADWQFRSWFDHEFITAIERRVPQARLILAGREGFPSRLPKATVEHWDRPDSDQFLARRGLADPALAKAVFRHCAGHPLVTGLAVDVWKSGLQRGDPLLPGQLRHATNEQAATRWLMEQLYQRLPPELEDIVRVAVRLQSYQPDLINHLLADRGDSRLDDRCMAILSALSLTEQRPHGGLRAHDLVREVEDARFRQWQQDYRKFHRRASEHCAVGGDILGSIYHGIAADEDVFAGMWLAAAEHRRVGHMHAEVEALISVLEAPERRPRLQPGTVGLLRLEQALLASTRADFDPPADVPARERREQSEVLLGEALESFAEARSPWGLASASQALGALQARTARSADAETSYGQALRLFRQIEDREGEANTLHELGRLQARTGRSADAETAYLRALDLHRQVENRLGEAYTLHDLGDLQMRSGRLADAEASLEQALHLYRQSEDRIGEAKTLRELGDLQMRTARLADAEASYRQALALCREVEDRIGEAHSQHALDGLQIMTGRLADAEASCLQALALFRETEERSGEADALGALGDVQLRTDRLADAEASHTRALDLFRQDENQPGEAKTLLGLGNLQFFTGRLGGAEALYQQALDLFRRLEDRSGEAQTLDGLGRLFSVSAADDQAEACFTDALAIYFEIGDLYAAAGTLANRGRHRVSLGGADGFADWRQALDLAVTVDPFLFSQLEAITLGFARQLLGSGTADEFLATALPRLRDSRDSDGPFSADQRAARDAALTGFAQIQLAAAIRLGAIRASGLPPGDSAASALLAAARQLDEATSSAFAPAALAADFLDHVTPSTGEGPLVPLVADWIRAATWDESETFLSQHHEQILTADGQSALAALARANANNQTIAVHVNLLNVARRHGVRAAYAQLRSELAAAASTASLNEWLDLAPDWPASAAYLAEHRSELSDPAAVPALAAACEGNPDDARPWLHLGLLLMGEQAADGFAAADTGTPDPFDRTRNLLAEGNLDEALAWAHVARSFDICAGALLLAKVRLWRGEPDLAAAALAAAVEHADEEQLADILTAYADLLRAQPDHPGRYAEHASALERAGQFTAALAAYEQAIALDTRDATHHFNKGQLLFALSQFYEARLELLDVIGLRPDDALGARVLLAAIAWPDDPTTHASTWPPRSPLPANDSHRSPGPCSAR